MAITATVVWVDVAPDTGDRADHYASRDFADDEAQDALAWAWGVVERELSEHATDVRVLIDGKDVTP